MRIALVHDWLTGMRGGERCLEALCQIWPQAHVFTLLHRQGAVSRIIEQRRIVTSFLQRLPGGDTHHRWLLPLMPAAASRLRLRERYDAVVSLSHAVAKAATVPRGVPHVCYCFTPIRWAWHCVDDYLGRRAGEGSHSRIDARRLADRVADVPLRWLRRWDRAVTRRVTHFLACSRTVADRIRDCYGRHSVVIYPPVATDYFTPADEGCSAGDVVSREDYYLCVSALTPYKRLDLAVQACRQLGRRLVIIGRGPEEKRLRQLTGSGTQLLGWQPDAVVREHLRRCRALLFPGREDFGIVPVEAQACGTPIIAYGAGGARETVLPATIDRAGTGLLFTRQTPDALVDAIRWFEAHPRAFSAVLARRWAERFAVERFQRQFSAYVEAVIACQANGAYPSCHSAVDPRVEV